MDFKENKAIYLQIAEHMMDEILQGLYPENDRIPSVREYAAMVEVNVNTCMRAYDWLCSQDIIFTKRGLGYFVCEGAGGMISQLRKQEFFEQVIPELRQKMQALNISTDDLIKAL
ncbi:MAG: GntR family transcriptional regulator [Bacteroidaceae bacterium]|nr:GntR family transcriptional regulator [Bacteroidaceae bacterium]